MNITTLRIPPGRRHTSWLFTSATQKLNSGLPRTTSVSGQNGIWNRDKRISNPALYQFGHAASYIDTSLTKTRPKTLKILKPAWKNSFRIGCGSSLTALMMTDVGVLTLNENPSCFAPFTKAPSSAIRKTASKKVHEKTCTYVYDSMKTEPSRSRWRNDQASTENTSCEKKNQRFWFLQFFLQWFLKNRERFLCVISSIRSSVTSRYSCKASSFSF